MIRSTVVTSSVHDGIQLTGPSTGLETSAPTRNTANRNGDWGSRPQRGSSAAYLVPEYHFSLSMSPPVTMTWESKVGESRKKQVCSWPAAVTVR